MIRGAATTRASKSTRLSDKPVDIDDLDENEMVPCEPRRIPRGSRTTAAADPTPLEKLIVSHAKEKESIAEAHMEELDAALGEARVQRKEIIELEKQLSTLRSQAKSDATTILKDRLSNLSAVSALARLQQEHAKQKAELEVVKAEGVKKDTGIAKLQARLLELEKHREACTKSNLELAKLKDDYIKSVNELIAARDGGGAGAGPGPGPGAGAPGSPIEGGQGDVSDELAKLRRDHVTYYESSVNDNLDLLRKCRIIKLNPMIDCHPKFPIDPKRFKIVPQSRDQSDRQAWGVMNERLVQAKHHNDWAVACHWAWDTWENNDYGRGKFDWIFNKLFEMSIAPQNTDKETLEWLGKLYDNHVKGIMTADGASNIRVWRS